MSRQRIPRMLLALSILLMAGCMRVVFGVANLGVSGHAIVAVEYDHPHALSLDVHAPRCGAASKMPCRGAPVIVFFHGGSWRNGDREGYRFVGQSLARAGFLVVVPDYRKAPQVVFPAFMDDVALAVAWTRAHAAAYGGDPSRIVLVGHSSGAHLAALLGTDARYLRAVGMRPRDLAGIAGIAGPYDFLPLTDPDLVEVFGTERDWPASQPVNFVDGDEPPFLLVQGTADTVVNPRNAGRLAARLRAAGEPVEVRMREGAGHAGLLLDMLRAGSPVRDAVLRFAAHPVSSAAAPPR